MISGTLAMLEVDSDDRGENGTDMVYLSPTSAQRADRVIMKVAGVV